MKDPLLKPSQILYYIILHNGYSHKEDNQLAYVLLNIASIIWSKLISIVVIPDKYIAYNGE